MKNSHCRVAEVLVIVRHIRVPTLKLEFKHAEMLLAAMCRAIFYEYQFQS